MSNEQARLHLGKAVGRMIDHAKVARDVIIAASVTGTTATLAVNSITTVVSATTDDELRARLVHRAGVVAAAIDLPVQMKITAPDHEQVLLVAPDGETEVIDALLPEPDLRGFAWRPLIAAAGLTAAALVVGSFVRPVDDAPGRPLVSASVEGSASTGTSRSTVTIPDRDPLPMQRGADVRVASSAPAVAGGLTAKDPIEETAPAATEQPVLATTPPSTTPPPATAPPDNVDGDHSADGGGPADPPEPPAPVDPNDVPDPVDPDDPDAN